MSLTSLSNSRASAGAGAPDLTLGDMLKVLACCAATRGRRVLTADEKDGATRRAEALELKERYAVLLMLRAASDMSVYAIKRSIDTAKDQLVVSGENCCAREGSMDYLV